MRPPVRIFPAIWLALFVSAAFALQQLARIPWDADTAYHLAVARLLGEHGVLHAFPWTPFSWHATHYADKELLFHFLLVPLNGLDWITAAHVAGTALSALLLFTLYLVLRAQGAAFAGAWAFAALASSGYFVQRFALIRPHLLSASLALVVVWAAANRRYRALALACLLFPFCYVAWHQAVILTILAEAARLLARERPTWKTPTVAVVALGVGVLVHPQFPEIVRTSWISSVEILFSTAWAKKAGFELGTEFTPLWSDVPGLLRYGLGPLTVLAIGAALAWRRRVGAPQPLAFALAGLAWAVMTLLSARFVEYLAPFAVIPLALAAAPTRWLGPAALAALTAFTAAVGREPIEVLPRRAEDFPPAFAAQLAATVPDGAQVFTCGWVTTGEMMLALPNRKFVVALDPVLFARWDPALYRTWFDLVHHPPPQPASVVRDTFSARWVLCESRLPGYQAFLQAMVLDPKARLAVANELWVLFEVLP